MKKNGDNSLQRITSKMERSIQKKQDYRELRRKEEEIISDRKQ